MGFLNYFVPPAAVNTTTAEAYGTTDGSSTTFTHTLANAGSGTYVIPGTVSVVNATDSITAADTTTGANATAGLGKLTAGSGLSSSTASTVNYITGAVSVTYSSTLTTGHAITVTYSWATIPDTADFPTTSGNRDLFWQNLVRPAIMAVENYAWGLGAEFAGSSMAATSSNNGTLVIGSNDTNTSDQIALWSGIALPWSIYAVSGVVATRMVIAISQYPCRVMARYILNL